MHSSANPSPRSAKAGGKRTKSAGALVGRLEWEAMNVRGLDR